MTSTFFISRGCAGINVHMFKSVLLHYADGIGLFAKSSIVLQLNLDLLEEYCTKWKFVANTKNNHYDFWGNG